MQARVLIADDDEALADNLAEIVATLDVIPIRAPTAREALRIAQEVDLAVALVDLRLPDGSGGDLVRGLPQGAPFCQVILVTGDATVETAAAAVSDGAFAYVLKPFSPEKLLATVQLALDQSALLRERFTLQNELSRSERRHREVVEAVPALVMALDKNGRVALWNRRLEEFTGYSRQEKLGSEGRAMVGPGKEPAPMQIKGGGQRLVRWEQTVLEGGDVYAVGIDVTEEQQMLRRTLRAERLAAVGTMAAGLAHEIRNPLNAALLQLTLLQRRLEKPVIDKPGIAQVANVIQGEIKRLERLVQDFLAFARPRQLEIAPLSINDLCRQVVALVQPEVDGHKVDIKCDLQKELPDVEGDSARLHQVLLNLVRNALEAMPDGGSLILTTRLEDLRAVIEVHDTGVGIEDDGAIFDAFFTTKAQGTGLGLSLVHRIISDHGGQITVRSQPGATCFSFWLPFATKRSPVLARPE